jgi:hypothetical protein
MATMTTMARPFLPRRLLAFSAAALSASSLALLATCGSRCDFATAQPYSPSYYAVDWTTTTPSLRGERYVDDGFVTRYCYAEDGACRSFGILCDGDDDDGDDDGDDDDDDDDDDGDDRRTGGAVARAISCLSLCASAIVSLALSASTIGIATAFPDAVASRLWGDNRRRRRRWPLCVVFVGCGGPLPRLLLAGLAFHLPVFLLLLDPDRCGGGGCRLGVGSAGLFLSM